MFKSLKLYTEKQSKIVNLNLNSFKCKKILTLEHSSWLRKYKFTRQRGCISGLGRQIFLCLQSYGLASLTEFTCQLSPGFMDYLETIKLEYFPVEEPTRNFGARSFMFLLEISRKRKYFITLSKDPNTPQIYLEVLVANIWIPKETAADKRISAPQRDLHTTSWTRLYNGKHKQLPVPLWWLF